MVSMVERWAAALVGFGFVALTLTAGIVAALLAGAGAIAAYGLVAFAQRRRLDRVTDEFMADRARDRHDHEEPRRTRSRSRRAA